MSINRRRFLQTTTSATTALMFSSLEVFAKLQSIKNMNNNFKLKVLATKWGFNGTIDEYCAKVKQEGYDGQGKTFIEHTIALAKSTGIKICHETHRSRLLYSTPVASHYIETVPDLRITFDVSHWCNVHESLLEDQQETVDMALKRVDHIHARIGHAEGPQVNDPRAPEWDETVKAHFTWWDKIVEMKKQKGEVLTILTEFGPPDYMPTMPYTKQPLADQWAINVHMMHLLRKRYIPNH